MEAWLDIRAIRIPRPKLVSTISAAAVAMAAVASSSVNASSSIGSVDAIGGDSITTMNHHDHTIDQLTSTENTVNHHHRTNGETSCIADYDNDDDDYHDHEHDQIVEGHH